MAVPIPIRQPQGEPFEKTQPRVLYGRWAEPGVPHSGWSLSFVEDFKCLSATCGMCLKEEIRYAHHMEHPDFQEIVAGCICAGYMQGDIEGAKAAERRVKGLASWRKKRGWHIEPNRCYKISRHCVASLHRRGDGKWSAMAYQQEGSKRTLPFFFGTFTEALDKSFDLLREIQ